MVLLSFLGACSHIKQSEMQVQHIPINLEKNKVLNLSSFCDSIEIVPLQTTKENLIGEIGWIMLALYLPSYNYIDLEKHESIH